ncbi:MAG: hypothetical protein LBF79_03610 [Dysgonamonadaceae bacterium]|nr:hypothetical protein [Dysgonamonadaceae bacterium]
MGRRGINLADIEKRDPFRVPEGYFEGFVSGFMLRLPERQARPVEVIGFWGKVRPWVYMAAMFIGISLTVRLFTGFPAGFSGDVLYTGGVLRFAVDSDLEDYYDYYEDDLANICLWDTIAGLSN